ncbi:cupredoxin domain-containing protein [Paenibacillus kobensis]|uniref:cupredoxin domain-containing protein n=1 Tax=Paenibacillus kobensis TaxID=59841 RepID=UPI000FD8510E|nr:cupredoxin domain-containing protein [Paenibacillus kobensis]
MTKFVVVPKRYLQLAAAFLVMLLLMAAVWRLNSDKPASAPVTETQVFQFVTGEFETTDRAGKMLEAYQWSPGSIYVTKGTPVELQITGISGDRHPFEIEGLGIKGEVLKGKTTVVRFTPKEAGTYAIRCLTHADMRSGGPMVGYIFVH